MIYLPLTTLQPAQVSTALWALSRPDYDANSTHYYCGWITHPTTGQHALTLNEADTQPIHAQADVPIAYLVTALRPIVGDAQADVLQLALTTAKGGRINIVESLPQTLKSVLLTHDDIVAGGWIDDEQTLEP